MDSIITLVIACYYYHRVLCCVYLLVFMCLQVGHCTVFQVGTMNGFQWQRAEGIAQEALLL